MKFNRRCRRSRATPCRGSPAWTPALALALVFTVALLNPGNAAADPSETPRDWCPHGAWVDFMLGAYHIHPDRKFDDFDPGIGFECGFKPEWAASAGYFRNSVWRPSFYGGVVYTPEKLHWGWIRLGALGGIISGYNFGSVGFGSKDRTGFILVPSAITTFGPFAANFILVPPIPADHVPLTVGLQVKYRFH